MIYIKWADSQEHWATILETVKRSNQAVLISHQGHLLVKILPVVVTPHTGLGSMANTGKILGDIITPIKPSPSEWEAFK